MTDELIDGPDQYWSDHVPPSRGQYRDLALLGLRLLGIEAPKSRLEATTAMVRLRAAIRDSEQPPPVGVPYPW